MTSAKAVLGGVLGRFIFREATVSLVEPLGARFRRLVLSSPALRGVSWTPGDKLQVFLPEAGTRAYTPTRWDSDAGETELLIYLHGDGPGTAWASSVQAGARVQVFGPRGSLVVGERTPGVIFGDETSVGLVRAHGSNGASVLEVTDARAVREVLDGLGCRATTLVERAPQDGHLGELVSALEGAVRTAPHQRLVLSGRAAAIQEVRKGLKARGVSLSEAKTKAYWAPGKVGLD
ncbi:siderophore-interacting protein [Hyalangium gracile]|uniref:siderophore-interacting protein n=1 Tax=Hyalangium gracile TaxID=394092 RepID=UPI001CC9450B|nr:siderophore-interacting protein [Hyalangium gracile]